MAEIYLSTLYYYSLMAFGMKEAGWRFVRAYSSPSLPSLRISLLNFVVTKQWMQIPVEASICIKQDGRSTETLECRG